MYPQFLKIGNLIINTNHIVSIEMMAESIVIRTTTHDESIEIEHPQHIAALNWWVHTYIKDVVAHATADNWFREDRDAGDDD